MKQETKDAIKWIKKIIDNTAMPSKNSSSFDREYANFHNALALLNSLPELEEQLKYGGFIPDMNKTPCKHGDKIRIAETNGSYIIGSEYKLNWDKDGFYFAFLNEDNKEVGYPDSNVKIIKVE